MLFDRRRKINFKQFEDALKMIAEKKFPGTEDSLEKLKAKILEGGGPMTHGVTVSHIFNLHFADNQFTTHSFYD